MIAVSAKIKTRLVPLILLLLDARLGTGRDLHLVDRAKTAIELEPLPVVKIE